VLKTSNPAPGQPALQTESAAGVRVGQEVPALGTPFGFLQNTVTRVIAGCSGAFDIDMIFRCA
jgi:hypothetical protein